MRILFQVSWRVSWRDCCGSSGSCCCPRRWWLAASLTRSTTARRRGGPHSSQERSPRPCSSPPSRAQQRRLLHVLAQTLNALQCTHGLTCSQCKVLGVGRRWGWVRFTARRMSIVREALADEVLETQQPDVVKRLIAQVAR